jgi:eukaryotic-like serine/threonine-protein kinase
MPSAARHCPVCHAPLSADVPVGICPGCALRSALDPDDAGLDEGEGTTIGRYKLLQKIGEGGFGVVYMAEQKDPVRRRVALKIIKLGMDTREVIARFEAERQALALMDHPNIAKVFDGGTTGSLASDISNLKSEIPTGRAYFVMELVRGIRITDFCDQHHYSPKQRLELFIQVCQAVQHAHQKGIIHRDLKPSNILVTLNDGVAVPKVIDFGIAKATEQRLTDKTVFTRFFQFLGTPAYISPEQAEMTTLDVDTRSDIYSLGVLLYELLTGRTPFDGKELLQAGLDEMRRTIRDKQPPKPSTRLGALPEVERTTMAAHRGVNVSKLVSLVRGDLDWIVMKCLEKNRARRYETANNLAADIRRHLNQEPVVARPPSTAYRLQKFVRRHRGGVLAAAVTLLALMAGLFMSERQRRETERQRNRATEALSRLQLQKAQELLAADRSNEALAYMARVLRDDRDNRVAAEMVLATLTHRGASLPLVELSTDNHHVSSVKFSPDGQRVVTAGVIWERSDVLRKAGINVLEEVVRDGVIYGRSDGYARVWDALTGQPLTERLRHKEGLNVQFSPDGECLVTSSWDKTARVWDAHTGQPLTEPLQHADWVRFADFSPDSRWVVTVSTNYARVWEARTGKALTEFQHKANVNSARFSPNGLWVVTASSDKTARVWEASTGQAVTGPLEHNHGVYSVYSARFSPDGLRLVTACGGESGYARVWDARTGVPLTEPLKHEYPVDSAQFSPDGQQVLTVCGNVIPGEGSYAQVWDARTGQALTRPLKHNRRVTFAQFSRDGQQVLTASYDHTARVWDARTGELMAEPIMHVGPLISAQFSPDGRRVATAGHGGHGALLWDLRNGRSLTEPLKHDAPVNSAEFSPDGQRVVTGSNNQTAQFWDAHLGRPWVGPLTHKAIVRFAAFNQDGQRVVTLSGNEARVWDARGSPTTEPLKHEGFVRSAQFSPDGGRLVTASADHTARVWDARTGHQTTAPLKHEFSVASAQFSPDGERIVTASMTTVQVWDAHTGQVLNDPIEHYPQAVFSAEFSPDGKRLVTSFAAAPGGAGYAQIWDAGTGRPLTEPLKHDSWLNSAQFSADGEHIVTACADHSARVWNARTGQPVTEPLQHGGQVASAQFSPDGRRVVTASWDNTARVWDARTGHAVTEPIKHQGRVLSARFSPDGQQVLTASDDGTAQVWDIPVAPLPIPDWVAEIAEAAAAQRIGPHGLREPVAPARLFDLRRKLANSPGPDVYSRWARWFFAERSTRTISPFATLTVQEYIQRRIEENTLASLREAVWLSPTNGLAFAKLAAAVLAQPETGNPRRAGEADFFSRHAMKLSPEDPEVMQVRTRIEQVLEGVAP